MATFGPWTIVAQPTVVSPITSLAIGPKSIEWQMDDVVAANENPFNLSEQYYAWNQSQFECSVSWAYLTNPQHFALMAWFAGVQGGLNVFPFGDPFNTNPQNPAATSPTVNGANQSGYTLLTHGISGQTVGDWISLPGNGSYATGSRLYIVTSISGSTLGIWPPIRESPSDGATVGITNCTGMFRLKGNKRKIIQNVDKTWSWTYEIREAL